MKLKKLLTLTALAFITCSGAFAGNNYPKIYINPGHGSWASNDRPMSTIKHGYNDPSSAINDTTNFFESNTNLRKGLALLHQLAEYGIPFDKTKNQTNSDPSRLGAALDLSQTNIVMSHVKAGAWPAYINGSANPDNAKYNRNLTEIVAEAESWGADLFISIHSNAVGSTQNQTSTNFLYFAWDNKYTTAGADNWTMGSITDDGKTIRDLSIAISKKAWNHRILDRHQSWTHYDNQAEAGTVKISYQNLGVLNHAIPGYLVEGFFHDYSPARHRYMNPGVCALEGIDYARGVADYFGLAKESNGDIYGVVRDKNIKFSHEYYAARSGTNDEFKPLNDVTVTLKQNGTVVATTTTDDEWNGAFVFNNIAPGNYTLEFSHPKYHNYVVNSSSASITSTTPTSLSVTVEAAKTSYPIAFIQGRNLIDEATFTLENVSPLANYITNKTVRRTILRDDILYVLALNESNEPYIYIANLSNNTVTELDKKAVVMGANGRLKISDIALTNDGYLIANGMSKTHYNDETATTDGESRGIVNFYKWSKNATTGLPETCSLWFTTNNSCNYYRCIYGKTITYSGTLNNGYITVYNVNGGEGKADNPLLSKITISNGKYDEEVRNTTFTADLKFNPSALSTNDDHLLYTSPLASDNCVLDGNAIDPFEWTFGEVQTPTVNGRLNAHTNSKANGISFFYLNSNTYLVSPAINSNGLVSGVEIYDITNGFGSGTLVKTISLKSPVKYNYSAAYAQVETNDDDSIEINLYLVAEHPDNVMEEPEEPVIDTNSVYPDPVAAELPSAELKSDYSFSENLSETIPELSGKSIRRAFVRDDYMYVLATGANNVLNIYAINIYDFSVSEISTTGATAPVGNTSLGIKIADIALTADGYLMGCNYDHTVVNDASKVTYIYYWDKDEQGFPTGNPIQWYRSSMSGLFNNSLTGATMCSAGKLNNGTVLVSCDHLSTSTPTGKFRTMKFTKENGSMIIENPSIVGQASNVYGSFDIVYCTTYGDKYKYCVSPLNENNFILDGNKKGATELSYEGVELKTDYKVIGSENLVDASVTGTSYFKYAGSALMVAPIVSNGQCTGVQMINVSNGLAQASLISSVNTDTYSTNLDNVYTCGRSFVDGTEGMIDLFLLRGDKLQRFTSESTLVGVESINDANAPVEYYNLQGVKVNNPANGIFIKKQGNKTTKVVL